MAPLRSRGRLRPPFAARKSGQTLDKLRRAFAAALFYDADNDAARFDTASFFTLAGVVTLPRVNKATDSPLAAVRDELKSLTPPVILFNKSHSGSRFLARLVAEAGVFMGAHQNESNDSWDALKLVEYLVSHYYPDYSALWKTDGVGDR